MRRDARAGRVVDGQHALRLVHLGEDLARVVKEELAGRRRPDAGARAHQQLHAELALLRGDLLADRRLTQAEAPPGAGEAAHVDDGDERAQQARVELWTAALDRRLGGGDVGVLGRAWRGLSWGSHAGVLPSRPSPVAMSVYERFG
jgi:hypothetical protein